MITMLHPGRLEGIKRSFVTRRVPLSAIRGLDQDPGQLAAGDIVLARVEECGQHQKIELPCGRRAVMHPGDEIMVACGARYAPDQFHAEAPSGLGPANLVAAGGIAGLQLSRNSRIKDATRITILGRLIDQNARPLNVWDFRLDARPSAPQVPVILVVGTSMNAGKTATCAALLKGIRQQGLQAGYVKATGTGSGGDIWTLKDAGANPALDFTDAGLASTYRQSTHTLVDKAVHLLDAAADEGSQMTVLEIADGLLQVETAALLLEPKLKDRVLGTVLAARDSMGAVAGVNWLLEASHNVLGITGAFTQAPLAMKEFALVAGMEPLRLDEICSGAIVSGICEDLQKHDVIAARKTVVA
ncbi:MAG: DUF1611 domain-containing protein [Pseudomonadota bacterium]